MASIAAGVIGAGCLIANEIDDFFSGTGSNDYHPGSSTTEASIKKNADELAGLKTKIRKSSEKMEEDIIGYINETMNGWIKELESINGQDFGGKALNININYIREKNKKLKNEVVGCISDYVDGKLVLTDSKLSSIFKQTDDWKRKREFDAYCIQLQKQALSNLKRKIQSTIHEQEKTIRNEIQMRLDEVERNMREATKAYNEILQVKEQDNSKMGNMRMKYIYQYELSEILLEQLEN